MLSRLPFPSSEDLLNPGIEPESLASPTLAGGFFTTEPPGKPIVRLFLDNLRSALCSELMQKSSFSIKVINVEKEI